MKAAMMSLRATTHRAQGIATALDDAIVALTALDERRLLELESEVSRMTIGAGHEALTRGDWSEIEARHRLLGRLLASTQTNLSMLDGLHRRNRMGDERWAR